MMPSDAPSGSDPVAAFVAAVNGGDVGGVRHLLGTHPELAARINDSLPGFSFGATPLLAALPAGNPELIDLLLEVGADINQKSRWWAGGFGVLDGDHGLSELLIDRGAAVDVHAASRLGRLDRLDQLLSADPGLVHARGGDGQTPLHVAPNVEVAAYLLDHGADIDALDIDHESSAAQGMVGDRKEVARFLASRGCRTDILLAAALGDLGLVRKHLNDDPGSVRMRVSDEYFPKRDPRAGGTIYQWSLGPHKTAHLLAREAGRDDIVDLLMEQSPIELQLASACELGDEARARALVAKYPDLLQAMSSADKRSLANAADQNNTEAVRLMLAIGWPVDVPNSRGATALHFAAWHGNAEMVREILRHHPPLEIRDATFNGPPIGWAIYGSAHGDRKRGDYVGTVEALLQAGAKAPPLTQDMEASAAVLEVLRRSAGSP
ncbi:MAG: ankyrin repeat domain-containing protein [Gemmatimonadota bacterium]